MDSQQNSISGTSIALFVGGILIIIGVIVYLVLGGNEGIKTLLTPLVDTIKATSQPTPMPLPNDMSPYSDGKNYVEPENKTKLDVDEQVDEYGGVKVDMDTNEEKVESISTYPIPTIHPWEPGGSKWQEEYWQEP